MMCYNTPGLQFDTNDKTAGNTENIVRAGDGKTDAAPDNAIGAPIPSESTEGAAGVSGQSSAMAGSAGIGIEIDAAFDGSAGVGVDMDAAFDGSAGIAADIDSALDINCPADACQPGGNCIVSDNDYICRCNEGFSGTGTKNCVNIDDCPIDNDCSPGGICVDDINTYHCECDAPTLEDGPPNSCRFTFQNGGIYDAMTNLTWDSGYGVIYKSSDSPDEYCLRQGNTRAPTVAEVNTIIGFGFFEGNVTLCLGTSENIEVCGPGDISGQDTFSVYCIL